MYDPRWNRLWIFFVIIAAGLAFSWTQVGKNLKQREEVQSAPVRLLTTEEGCDLSAGPCASMGSDLGLVVYLESRGEQRRLRLRTVGRPLTAGSLVRFQFMPAEQGATAIELPGHFRLPSEWVADYRDPPQLAAGWRLRVSLEEGGITRMADFPYPFSSEPSSGD